MTKFLQYKVLIYWVYLQRDFDYGVHYLYYITNGTEYIEYCVRSRLLVFSLILFVLVQGVRVLS